MNKKLDSVKLFYNNFYSFNLSKNKTSGAKRDRTVNLRLARAALSQLSYSPRISSGWLFFHAP